MTKPAYKTPRYRLPRYKIDDLSGHSQEQLIEEAKWWADQYREGEEGYCPPERATWTTDNYYPLSHIAPTEDDRQGWIEFIDDEIMAWVDEGQPRRFNDMKDGKIREHVVLLVRNGKHYVWDGNHRVGSAIKAGASTIPVIIGAPMSELEIQQKFGDKPIGKVSSGMCL